MTSPRTRWSKRRDRHINTDGQTSTVGIYLTGKKSPLTSLPVKGSIGIGLGDAHRDEVLKDAFRRSAMSLISGKFILKIGRKSFTDAPPM